MINCPYCGTPNRRGSKYCSNCGQRLGAISPVTCPACERLNPPGSTVCGFCGALLAPAAPVMGNEGTVEHPTKPQPTETLQRELPPWLYEQPTPQSETSGPPAATVQPTRPSTEERNKYLKDIHGVLPSTEAWLTSSVEQGVGKPVLDADKTANTKPKQRPGCLLLGSIAILGVIGLVLLSVL